MTFAMDEAATLEALAYWTADAITREVERGGALTRSTPRPRREG